MAKARRTCVKDARARRAQRFAAEANKAFDELTAFVRRRCRHRNARELDEALDELAGVVDTYIDLNYRILAWCRRNNVPERSFSCDVLNACGQKPLERRKTKWTSS